MKILMIAPQPFFRPRGTPFSVLHRIRALLRLGHAVDLITYPFGESPELTGLTIHRARRPIGIRDVSVGPSVAKLLLDVSTLGTAVALLRRNAFDLIHTHEEAGAFGAWMSRRLGIPHLYDMHSSLPQQFANFDRFNWRPVVSLFESTERYVLNRSDAVITICQDLSDHVVKLGYTGPLEVIENTLDFEPPPVSQGAVDRLRRRYSLAGKRTVVYTGTFERYQGLGLLIEAARHVVAEADNVRFVLVGGTGQQLRDLHKQAVRRGVEDLFVFVPAVPPADVFLYHRMADVLITTRQSGTNTPLKIYQYLRAGKPIVATSIYSHTQALNHRVAELVDPSPEAVGRGILRVLGDEQRARSMAENATRLAEECYSEELYLSRLARVLEPFGNGNSAVGAARGDSPSPAEAPAH